MPRVSSKKFFAEQSAHSRVKAGIVYRYVLAWAGIVLAPRFNQAGEAAYVDLFSGPGSYEDGSRSTPLLIVEQVLQKASLREGLRMFFNDKSPSMTNSLKQEIGALRDIKNLRYAPHYTSEAASIALIDRFSLSRETPQFYFLDQFGWSEITPSFIQRIFSNRRCDCAFFLRTPRVIAAVTNPRSESTMISVFGENGLESLQRDFKLRPREKEGIVLEKLKDLMASAGAPYFLPFPFRITADLSSRQHLIYLAKHPKGFELMKDIMAGSSTLHYGGVPTMGYITGPVQHGLFTVDPMPELEEDLLRTFAGRTLSVGTIFNQHHVTSDRYILKNYQEALRRLEARTAIHATPSSEERQSRNGIVTMSETVDITFPKRQEGV